MEINKFSKTMVPVGNTNGFFEVKKQNSLKKIDDDWKTQRHDEAKFPGF